MVDSVQWPKTKSFWPFQLFLLKHSRFRIWSTLGRVTIYQPQSLLQKLIINWEAWSSGVECFSVHLYDLDNLCLRKLKGGVGLTGGGTWATTSGEVRSSTAKRGREFQPEPQQELRVGDRNRVMFWNFSLSESFALSEARQIHLGQVVCQLIVKGSRPMQRSWNS